MFATHPIRHAWLKFCKDYGVPVSREIDVYVSGGFIGISRGFATFLNIWNSLVEALEGETGSLKELGFSHRPYPFYNGDQDALNITIMATDIPLSLIGKEGMDFSVGGYVMSHAAGSAKPWRKRMLVSALRGISPSLQDKAFWRHVRHPIRLYSASTLLVHRCDMIVGSAIGLVLKRA